MVNNTEKDIIKLFEKWAKEKKISFSPLPISGSSRKYYRIVGKSKTAIGVFYSNKKENIAFLEFSKHFFKKELNVPRVYSQDLKKGIYLIQDLGNETVFSLLTKERKGEGFSALLINIYKKVIAELVRFQISGGDGLNYKLCYPRGKFDRQSMLWDLEYFKYYFLKLAKIRFNEQELEKGFRAFIDYLLETDCGYFLYRDFQSRNIMILGDVPYFIDYQGGRKGALQYDLASLLFDAKANIPLKTREELLDYYIAVLEEKREVGRGNFLKYFYPYCIIRILQAMGSYGFRGFYQRKEHFLQSIPYALKNLDYLLKKVNLPKETEPLINVLKEMIKSPELKAFEKKKNNLLTVRVNSFSYKNGIPFDSSGNGGGFVFDCRPLSNPGRLERYKKLNGKNKKVIDFLEEKNDVKKFLKNVYFLIDQALDNYLERGFDDLMVNFGCTGGQHRSVYCSKKLVEHLNEKYNKGNKKIKIIVRNL